MPGEQNNDAQLNLHFVIIIMMHTWRAKTDYIKPLALIIIGVSVAVMMGKGAPPDWRGALLVIWPLLLAGFLYVRQSNISIGQEARRFDTSALWLACSLIMLSLAASDSSRSLIQGWWPATFAPRDIVASGIFRYSALAGLLMPLFLKAQQQRIAWLICILLIVMSGLCMSELIKSTGGAALYRDDHPSIMFRFWAFARSLPSPSYYNPFWNAGNIETASISSGLQALGILFWPFWRTMNIHDIYTPLTGASLIIIIPLMAMIALRLAGGGWISAGIAALLALAPGRFFFIWTLHYGTIPSGFSAAFALPLCGSLIHLLQRDKPSPWAILVMGVSLAGLASWPPGAIMAIPLGLASVLAIQPWHKAKLARLLSGLGLALVMLAPGFWGIGLFVDVGNFVSAESATATNWTLEMQKGFERLISLFNSSNVLIVFPGIVGCFALPQAPSKRVLMISLVGLLLITGWGLPIKPILQLNRAGVPLLFAAIIPAAIYLEHLMQKPGVHWVPLKAAAVSLLIMNTYSASLVYGNQWQAPYTTMNDDVTHMVSWIEEHAPKESRVMFAGPTVHAYGGGHVAYLPVLTGRSMMACDYYHFSPKKVEYEFPPKSFRVNDETIFEFLNLYNVSAVLTYHEHWKSFFRKYPDHFEETGVFGAARKRVGFKVVRPHPGWFLEGSGEIRQEINAIHVRLDNPHEPCTLRFAWIEGLQASHNIELQPHDMGIGGVQFIRVNPNGNSAFTLRWSQWNTMRHAYHHDDSIHFQPDPKADMHDHTH